MTSFNGTSGIEEIEAKTARIIDKSFHPQKFKEWAERNNVEFVHWWSYIETKQKDPDAVLIPFGHFHEITENHISLRYLKLNKEMALKITLLGHVAWKENDATERTQEDIQKKQQKTEP